MPQPRSTIRSTPWKRPPSKAAITKVPRRNAGNTTVPAKSRLTCPPGARNTRVVTLKGAANADRRRLTARKAATAMDTTATLTDALESAGYTPPYSCKSGTCSSCVARLIEGAAHMKQITALSDLRDDYNSLVHGARAAPSVAPSCSRTAPRNTRRPRTSLRQAAPPNSARRPPLVLTPAARSSSLGGVDRPDPHVRWGADQDDPLPHFE